MAVIRKRVLFALPLILSVSACVRAHTEMLDERTAIISGRGTAFDSMSGVTHHIFIKAARLAQARGFRYFQILNDQQAIEHSYMYTPGQSYTNGTVNVAGNTAYYNQSTTTTPGTVSQFNKPTENTMVRFYNSGEVNPNQPGIWDAQSVLAANPKS